MSNINRVYVKIRNILTSRAPLRARDGFLVVALIWVVVCILGSIPFLVSGVCDNFYDAFFESVSGFSTTGSTIFDDVDSLPKGILFWRALTHWFGGMGIVVFAMALIPSWGIAGQIMAYAETTGPSKGKLTSRFSDTAKVLYYIYMGFTFVEILLLKIGGMSWFDSVTMSFSTMGTGGFSNYMSSAADFSVYSQIILILFMTFAGINFNLYFYALSGRRRFTSIFKDEEVRVYLFIMGVSSLLIFSANSIVYGLHNAGRTLLDSVFQTVSIMTTTGLCTTDYELWPEFSKMILFCLFFIGGCACSTGGGVKVSRVLICLKLLKRNFSLRVHPNRIAKITLNRREIATDNVVKVTGFVFIYAVTIFAGAVLISFENLDYITSFSAAMSCIGNVGPGFGLVGPTFTFASFTNFTKLMCSLLMIIGRLEIYTVLVLFTKYYWNPNRV